ncbi:MAG: 2-phospho-L-lactate transferase CofD family protein [Deltaproteobacteria bacterium]|nr:2-phospho-L-lactate transferase CofD family protein [Deltaproteobacteria bacterium]MCL5276220.1 2-phospho-L-lactate transferase CofD family protein [Deltaproteobacteria bacterium]
MLNVVVLNGGRGAATLIPSLLHQQSLNVTSVVNAYDDGKSTGEIRRFFGMLGPSDIRKVQELMLPENDPDYAVYLNLFRYRYPVASDREKIMNDLRAFVKGTAQALVGLQFQNKKVRNALQHFLREFLDGLSVVEKASGTKFNFSDCSIMNCIYAGAFLTFNRNIDTATRYIDRLFKLKGTVLPTSIEDKKLVALRENGEMLYSEAEIVELRSNVRIERIYLLDSILDPSHFQALSIEEKRYFLEKNHCFVEVSESVKHALQNADIIIYSSGTQHSSLYPTYFSTGLAESIADNKAAFKVFITNIGADYETPNYKASEYLLGAYHYLSLANKRQYKISDLFNVTLINQSHLKADETYVEFDEPAFKEIPIPRVVDMFESKEQPGKHDGNKVVQTIMNLYEEATLLT